MPADTAVTTEALSKVDSAVDSTEPASPTEAKIKHRRASSTVSGVFNIADLGKYDAPPGDWRHTVLVHPLPGTRC